MIRAMSDLDNSQQSIQGREEVKHAVVIGINEYENKEIPRLQGAEYDATELKQSLINPALGFIILDGHFLQGKEATRKNIEKTISDIFRKSKEQSIDLILFYFSGHGFVDEETKKGYIAPYDMDPQDPEYCGIRMDYLRDTAFGSKTKANVLLTLDCCYAGIVTTGTRGNSTQTKNIYAEQVQGPYSPNENALIGDTGKSRLLIASSEADMTSHEKTTYKDPFFPNEHPHGAFSYHLIQGLGGGAADNQGLITFESLQKYLEVEMLADGNQRPLHSAIDESYRLDKIRIGKSMEKYRSKIEDILRDAKEYSCTQDLRSLRIACQNIRELEGLQNDNNQIPILIENVNVSLKNIQARELIQEWLDRSTSKQYLYVGAAIDQIRPGLVDGVFRDFAENLSYEVLRNVDDTAFQYLTVLYYEAMSHKIYATKTSPELIRLINRLKQISSPQVAK